MAAPHEILLLSDDEQKRDRWKRELGAWANVSTSLETLQAGGADWPELIVTDKLPLSEPLGQAAEMLSHGEIAILGIGTKEASDVVLPEDCSGRELRMACRLTVEIVRLRRRIAEELRTQRALRKMAYRDPLTGLGNRRKWDQELVVRLERLKDQGPTAALGIVLFDLDFFKPLNDQLGHLSGDNTLQRVAHTLAANLADQHLAARIGGDEFGVLLSGILPTDVPDVADLVRRSLTHQPEGAVEERSFVTASAGVVVVRPTDAVRPLDALQAADRALRLAKQQGRDRTVIGSLHES